MLDPADFLSDKSVIMPPIKGLKIKQHTNDQPNPILRLDPAEAITKLRIIQKIKNTIALIS